MDKEKVVFFLDYANINRAAREKRYRLDYYDLLQYVSEGRFLIDAHCYVPINPRNEHRLDGVIEELWRSGYIVTTKIGSIAGGTYKCNFDVEIAMDMLKVVYQTRPDIVVLASADADFVPLIQEVRKSGVRVEVAAFAETAGVDILLKCSGFIDLAVYYENYLAAQDGKQGEENVEERYKDLIQSQKNELDEERIAEQMKDLLSPVESDLNEDRLSAGESNLDEDDGKLPAGQVNDEGSMLASDIPEDLGL
jgi:uncharacterized LabA/DUF88 family protein